MKKLDRFTLKAFIGPFTAILLVVVFILLGSLMKVDIVWNASDMFNGLMVIPNLLAVLALSGLVVKEAKKK